MVNHTGGSQTFEVTLKRMRKRKNGKDPDPAEFHLLTHTLKRKSEIIFCDDHAKQVNADYLQKEKEALSKLQSEADASGSSVPTELPRVEKAAIFKEAAGGEKKGGVYGSGSAVSQLHSLECGGYSSSSTAGSSTTLEVVELRQHILRLEEALVHEREERNKSELRMYNMVKKMMSRPQQHEDDEGDDEYSSDDEGLAKL